MEPTEPIKFLSVKKRVVLSLLALLLVAGVSIWLIFTLTLRSTGESQAQPVIIPAGATIREIAHLLQDTGVVRYELPLYWLLIQSPDPTGIQAGQYDFSAPYTLAEVAKIVTTQAALPQSVRLTLPEGLTAAQMAPLVAEVLASTTAAEYVSASAGYEGYLWPDTYDVPLGYAAPDMVALQLATGEAFWRARLADPASDYENQIILASILEREANSAESMAMVAGVFSNRLAAGMPLQADATIEYVLDTPLHELPPGELAANLRELDSPYNTYLNPGLPPTAIGNPGATAVEAVLNPVDNNYLFYLTAPDGTFYYAETFAEHQANIARYLR